MLAAFGSKRRSSRQPRAADTGPALGYASPRLATHTSGHSESFFKGWKDLLFTLYGNIGKHRIFTMAGGITFYSIIALFPAIAALVALYSLFADPEAIRHNLDELGGILPGGAIQVIGGELHHIASQKGKTLGSAFAIGFAVALWSANSSIKALLDALNLVYDETESRGFIRFNADLDAVRPVGDRIRNPGDGRACCRTYRAQLCPGDAFGRHIAELCPLAGAVADNGVGLGGTLSLRAQSRCTAVALDQLGKWLRRGYLARCFRPVRVVRGKLRHLQPDLWFARRGDGLHGVDLDLDGRDPAGSGSRCRNGATVRGLRPERPALKARRIEISLASFKAEKRRAPVLSGGRTGLRTDHR